MKAAHPQLNRPGIGKLGWKVLHLVRGGRDLGDLFHIRAAWCLWIEQHAALVGGGKYPALSGKK